MQPKGINTTLIQKILVTFLVSGIAITGLYMLSRQVLFDINQSFRTLSEPNQKLNAVNRLFAEMVLSDKSFTDLVAYENEASLNSFTQHSDAIAAYTDSLKMLCAGNNYQTSLIDSLQTLVNLRKQKLLKHFSYRQGLRRKNIFAPEIQSLDSLISTDTAKGETTIYNNRETVTTTTFDTIETETNRKGLLNRIFKPKKKTTITVPVEEITVLEESDTLEIEARSEVYEKAQKVMADISKKNRAVQNELKQKETAIDRFEKEFKDKVTKLLFAIEGDIISQTGEVQSSTRETLRQNVERVRIILIAFSIFSVLLLTLIVIDMARRKKYRLLLEEATVQAEQASKSKQALLSNVSHEIRTPLQSVIGYAEQLQHEPGNQAYTNAITKASGHLLQVVNEVLDYSSIEAGKFAFNQENFDVEAVIEEVMVLIQPAASARGLSLQLDNQLLEEVVVKGDPFRLKQVLLNLLGNAIKFTDAGTITLTVGGTQSGDDWLMKFAVADTGMGIPLPLQERIFERFEQVTMTGGNTGTGTGLGLSITRAIVDAQGGSISVKSTPGKGSIFSFCIAYPKGNSLVSAVENQQVIHDIVAREVWLLEDDMLIGQLISLILKKNNIPYRSIGSGEELLYELKSHVPGIVLTDISMPGMGGEEVCRRIKSSNPEIVVIAITAHALPDEQQALISHGFNEVIVKPFGEAKLLAALGISGKLTVSPVVDRMEEEPAISTMKKAIGTGDEDTFRAIAEQFSRDTKADLIALQSAIGQVNAETQTALLHRVAGRVAQIGFPELSGFFRKHEILSRQNPITDWVFMQPEWLKLQNILTTADDYLERVNGKYV